MRTILDIPTKGDAMTMPGGIVLRVRTEQPCFVVHYYADDPGHQRGYHQGGYHKSLADALEDVTKRAGRSERYTLGGAIDYGKLLGEGE